MKPLISGNLTYVLKQKHGSRTVMGALTLVSFVVGGSCAVAVGILIGPLMSEFGWPNSVTSGGAMVFTLGMLAAAPGAGKAIDGVGVMPVMALGVLSVSVGFFLLHNCHTPLEMFVAFAIAGVGYSTSFYVTVGVVVTNWMGQRKGLWMGVMMGAAAGGAALFSFLIESLIEAYGWRSTTGLIAVLVALTFPVTLVIRTRPAASSNAHLVGPAHSDALPVKGALLSRAFILSTTSSALYTIGLGGIYYHLASVLAEAKYSPRLIGGVIGASWIVSAIGSLGGGVVADRLGQKTVYAGAVLCSSIGIISLTGIAERGLGAAYVLAFVVLWGATASCVAQFMPVILAERFGTSDLGTLIGAQSFVMGIAGAAAPVVSGILYDRFHDYTGAICLSSLATFLAFIVVLFVDESKRTDRVAD